MRQNVSIKYCYSLARRPLYFHNHLANASHAPSPDCHPEALFLRKKKKEEKRKKEREREKEKKEGGGH